MSTWTDRNISLHYVQENAVLYLSDQWPFGPVNRNLGVLVGEGSPVGNHAAVTVGRIYEAGLFWATGEIMWWT